MDWNEPGLLAAVIFAGVAFAGAVAGALALLRSRPDPVLRRLQTGAVLAGETGPAAAEERGAGALARALTAMGQVARGDNASFAQLRRQLVQAGLRRESAAQLFLSSKVALALALPLAFLGVNATLEEPVQLALPISIWLCAGGFFLPNVWLSMRVAARQALVERGLPDALDLLVTCVEAGQGLDAALQRVSGDLALSWPLLSNELNLTFLEINAGIPRVEAFRRLHERTGVDELKTLAGTLAQAEMFGTSIAQSLRVQASGMRVRRMHRAEERAAVVAVKMTVPLVLCILPSLLAIIMGPAAVNIHRALFIEMGGN